MAAIIARVVLDKLPQSRCGDVRLYVSSTDGPIDRDEAVFTSWVEYANAAAKLGWELWRQTEIHHDRYELVFKSGS